MGQPPSDVGLQPLENKVLSWGIIGKSASILAEIMIRKSQFHIFTHKQTQVSISFLSVLLMHIILISERMV
jgi:hypothetical protein